MKIYSKFHDYYDCIQKMGVDKSVVYNREQKEIRSCSEHKDDIQKYVNERLILKAEYGFPIGIPSEGDIETTYGSERLDFFIVGFCGELYPGIEVRKYTKSDYAVKSIYEIDRTKITFLYSIEEANEYFSEVEKFFPKRNQNKKFLSSRTVPDSMVKMNCLSWLKDCYYPTLFSEFFPDKDKINDKSARSWFLKFKIPIFLVNRNYDSEVVTFNPCLKDVHFAKKFHPQEAFQKIQQFISNDLAEIKDGTVNPPTEKDRLIGHGFDPKWSFRKEPEVV